MSPRAFAVFVALTIASVLFSDTDASTFNPVIIVPGTGGSRIEAKLDKPSTKHFYCSKKSDWYTLWLSVTQLLPPAINCWVDNIKLLWDSTTGLYRNNDGVTTRVPGWGSTDGFEYLDPSLKVGQSDYFHTLVEALVSAGGVRNVSIRGSPYDFRHAPSSFVFGNATWLEHMTELVETTFQANGNKQVTILSHSMGCLYSLWFLNQKDAAWKAKYIKRWIPTAGVFGGAGSGIKQLLSGSNEGIPGVKGITVRDEQRSYESSMLLAPTPQAFEDFTLVQVEGKNYTASDYAELFDMSSFQNGFTRYSRVANLTANLVHPGVDVTHFYGTGVDTPTSFSYPSADFTKEPVTTTGDGDGTVPIASLRSVERWTENKGFTFDFKTFPKETHTSVLKSKAYLGALKALLLN